MTYEGLDEVQVWLVHEVHLAEGRSGKPVVEVCAGGFVLLVEIDEETDGHHDEKEGQPSEAEVLDGGCVNVVDQIWEPCLAWVEVVPGGSGELGGGDEREGLTARGR